MKHEIDIKHEVVAEIDGCQIIRSESRTFDPWTVDPWTGALRGKTKVYYDVCQDGEMLDSFKTRRQAEKFLKCLLTSET